MDLSDKARDIDYAGEVLIEENYLEPIFGS